jgi:maltooligosyltrehalose synthase
MMVGLRWAREFGPIMLIGAGGTDTETLNEALQTQYRSAIFSASHLPEGESQLVESLGAGSKLWLIRQVLHLRRDRSELFGPEGSYRPLSAKGAKPGHLIAYIRGEGAITLAPRLVMKLTGDWGDTSIELPSGEWRNILTDEVVGGGPPVEVAQILARFPVGFLVREAN